MKRRFAPIFIIVCLLLSGCGQAVGLYANYRPVKSLEPVQTLGLDACPGGVCITAVSGRDDDTPPLTLTARGGSIPEALDALQCAVPAGQLFFAHCRSVVIGKACAEAGIGPLLDYAERDGQTRLAIRLFVLSSGTAEALLTEAEDASGMLDTVTLEATRRGRSHVFSLRETAISLAEQGAALICALEPTEDGAIAAGFGILQDGRLTALLEPELSEAAGLLLGFGGRPERSFGGVTLEYGSELRAGPEATVCTLRAVVTAAEAEASARTEATEALIAAVTDDVDRLQSRLRSLDAVLPGLDGPVTVTAALVSGSGLTGTAAPEEDRHGT